MDVGSAVAVKTGADAPGGGISLCFCRRGCAAPAKKAVTLNALPLRLLPAKPFSFAATKIGRVNSARKKNEDSRTAALIVIYQDIA